MECECSNNGSVKFLGYKFHGFGWPPMTIHNTLRRFRRVSLPRSGIQRTATAPSTFSVTTWETGSTRFNSLFSSFKMIVNLKIIAGLHWQREENFQDWWCLHHRFQSSKWQEFGDPDLFIMFSPSYDGDNCYQPSHRHPCQRGWRQTQVIITWLFFRLYDHMD